MNLLSILLNTLLADNALSALGKKSGLSAAQLKKLILSGNPLSEAQIEELRKALPDCEIIF